MPAAERHVVLTVFDGVQLLDVAGPADVFDAATRAASGGGYPSLTVEPDRIYVRDGNVVTSAGVTAGVDLALALVEEDHGTEVARTVARRLVVFLHRPGGLAA